MSRAANSDYQFVSDDIDEILPEFITQYELTTNRTVQPSSPVRLFISWMASLFVEAYARINYSGNQNIPSRAEDENLDAIGELFFDDTRPGASPATVTMEFTITEAQSSSVLIPAGTRVSTSDGDPIFLTSEDVYIPIGETSITVKAECEEDGTSGNGFSAGQINTLIDVDNVLYFDHCENIDDSDGGADVAEDDEYYDLMVASEDAYSCAGARGAYEYWAKSVSTGIADVIVNSPTPGVIAIHTLMDDGQIAGDEIKAAILETCSADSVRPLTDHVTVVDPDVVSYDITMTYYLSEDSTESAADLQEAIENAVDDYVAWQCGKLGRDINPSKLIAMVMAAGAKRVVVTSPTFRHMEDGRDIEDPQTPEIAAIGTITLTNGGYEDE